MRSGPIERTHTDYLDLLPVSTERVHNAHGFPSFRGFSRKERDYHYIHVWAAPFGVVQPIKRYSTRTLSPFKMVFKIYD